MPDQNTIQRQLEQAHQGGRPVRTTTEHTPETLTKYGTLQEHLWKWHDKRKHVDGFAVCSACATVQLFMREHPKIIPNL